MPSITTWSRLEPQVSQDVASGYAAPVHDPLWLLARQWQVGEFQGEDGGTPIVARWRARVAPMTRYHAGPIPPNTQLQAAPFAADALPLEVLVERQAVQPPTTAQGVDGLRLAVESGQHFLRLLRLQATSADHSGLLTSAYAMPPLTDPQRATLDPDTIAYADLMAGRVLDGRRLRAALGDAANPHLDPALGIPAADVAEVLEASRAWLTWSSGLFSEPAPADQAWQPDRMEYAVSMSTRLGDDAFGERTLTADQYADGTLDWYSFNLNGEVNMGTGGDPPGTVVTRTVVPAPVTFRGMPASRFWEFEDARINLGSLQLGATDLPQLLTVETLTGYGNDWFVVPIELPVGFLAESRSLVVTDTFGTQTLIRPTGDPGLGPDPGWRMFSLSMPVDQSDAVGVAVTNLFFLAPVLASSIEGPPLEEVMLVRDELANLGWAIERRLESPLELGLVTARDMLDLTSAPTAPRDGPAYRIATAIPAHWVPLIPVQTSPGSQDVRLARGAVLDLDGVPHVVEAQARLLQAGDPTQRLLIREEEVPREGVSVRRAYQAARWYDGKLFVWAGNRASVGRGEASSGLAFDAIEPDVSGGNDLGGPA